MSLDKVVLNHLDKMEAIEDKIDADIDNIMSKIDIDEVMNDPEGFMLEVADIIQDLLEKEYYDKAVDNGLSFAKKIIEDGDIKIPKSKDPNLNEGI